MVLVGVTRLSFHGLHKSTKTEKSPDSRSIDPREKTLGFNGLRRPWLSRSGRRFEDERPMKLEKRKYKGLNLYHL